jgi:hypothetical protein
MKTKTKLIGLGAVAHTLGIVTYAVTAFSEEAGSDFSPPFMHPGMGHKMGGGMGGPEMMMGMSHDSKTMAQLGLIHELFIDHDRIKRTVTNLPDGIRTVTASDDPAVAQLLKTHVSDMMKRVSAGDDPGLPIESPALHGIFRDKDKVHTSVETTANGVAVVQTSDDPKTVAELQEHASEVTDFVKDGMVAMQRAMTNNGGGMMHDRMHSQ